MKIARNAHEIDRIRGRILDAALDIIVSHGLRSLTMRRMARHTGMSAPNIYNYFSSKEEIYISIVIRGFEMLYHDLKKACVSRDEPFERARAMIDAYLGFGMENSGYYEIMFTLSTPKYNDYVGTPFEKLSEVEYRISMDIADLSMGIIRGIPGYDSENQEGVVADLTHVWSLLHGMVSLYNSHIIGYVAPDTQVVYNRIIDDLLSRDDLLNRDDSLNRSLDV
ncbi:MAG: TetR/AcrR family transcriptional regulator [Thermodesulfobacteriota bacterium]|nr:TetR/AcrR family transcriptional regulator [Thermodesulfobacteriota bacterium]